LELFDPVPGFFGSFLGLLCVSAVDAVSYFTLQLDCMAISTSDAHANPAWLNILIDKGCEQVEMQPLKKNKEY
jgi:hypothetical protein